MVNNSSHEIDARGSRGDLRRGERTRGRGAIGNVGGEGANRRAEATDRGVGASVKAEQPEQSQTAVERRIPEAGAPESAETERAAQIQPGVQYGYGVAALATYAQAYQMLPLERTAELIRDLAGRMLSEGTLVRMLAGCAERVAPIEQQIKAALIVAPVAHFDETGLRMCGKLNWLHVASTGQLTHYAVDEKRRTLAHERIGILPHFSGVAIHDTYASYVKRDGPQACAMPIWCAN